MLRRSLDPQWTRGWGVLQVLRGGAGGVSRSAGEASDGTKKKSARWFACRSGNSYERRCAMSAAVVLPMVWARQEPVAARVPELAFYRKYTEGMLRRYMRLSMETGRVPSLIGQPMFRGRVTSYRVRSFEDVVIFVYDVEKCLARLDARSQELIARISLQEYTQG